MNGWNEYQMKREQYRDQARDADRYREIKLAADNCQESASGRIFGNLVSGPVRRRSASDPVGCHEHARLLEKAA